MFQQITLIGNLGNDPELRYTPTGIPVASFSLAVSKAQTKDGQKQEKTTWFRVSAWNKQAEAVSQYLHKGSKVLFVGEVEEARAFTDKQGNNRASLEVTAREIKFLSSKQDGGNGGESQQQQQAGPDVGDGENIPF